MILLALETSTPTGGVALLDDDRLLGSLTVTSPRGLSRLLLPAVRMLLQEAGLKPAGIDVVAVTRGPGAFTGVRVGLSIAKGLCLGGHPRLLTFSTLEALAHRGWGGEQVEYVLPLLNARQGEVYGAIHRIAPGIGVGDRVGEEFARRPEEVLADWPGRCLLVGSGAVDYWSDWQQGAGDHAVLAPASRHAPSAEALAFLALARIASAGFEDPATAGPIYLREATVNRPPKARPDGGSAAGGG